MAVSGCRDIRLAPGRGRTGDVFERRLTIDKSKHSSMVAVLRRFARSREYVIEERVYEKRFVIAIVDKKPDSALGMAASRVFFGGYFGPKRIRILITVEDVKGGIEVNVRGSVLLSEWNQVDYRPGRGDAMRCERTSTDVAELLRAL